jgi:FixJ family two-component response regulator
MAQMLAPKVARMPRKKNVIIVVDDDKAVRDSLKFSLQLDGMDVHVCDSADALLKYSGLGDAACLVVDYRMPETDGFVLGEKLAKRGVAVPRILITAPVSSALRHRAKAAGYFAVLEKPLLDDVLLRNVRAAIGT